MGKRERKTTSVGISDCLSIYGNRPANYEYVAVNHRGYIFARQSGDYTFQVSDVDNIVLVWVGPTAYSSFTRANALVQQVVNPTPQTYKVTFEQGKYYPMGILFGNWGGPGTFKLTLTAPDGTVVLGGNNPGNSPTFVQYSCDGTRAPRFAPFGSKH